MRKGFKAKIYPNEKQEEILKEYCRIAHDSWNFLVAKYKDNLPKVNKLGIKGYTQRDLINERNIIVPERTILGVIRSYCQAVIKFYKRQWNPQRFHKYDPNKQSFYSASMTISVHKDFIYMPSVGRGGNCAKSNKILIDTQVFEKFNITEIIEPHFTCYKGQWYVSGCYNVKDVQKREGLKYIGLDWGIKNFMTTMDGELINYPSSVLREFQRINRLKSYRDKKIKDSNNYNKINKKISKAYGRFEFLKRNFIEQTTTKLCKNNNIAVEDLREANIQRSTKARRRLKQIAPWYRFVEKLEWKCEKYGTTFKMVEPYYTSRKCSCCGHIKKELPVSERIYVCEECGMKMDRDQNAAMNIVARAICGSH